MIRFILLCFIIFPSILQGQNSYSIKLSIGGAFTKVNISDETPYYVFSNILPAFSISGIYETGKENHRFAGECRFLRDGARYKINNYFNKDHISGAYARYNAGFTGTYLRVYPLKNKKQSAGVAFGTFVNINLWDSWRYDNAKAIFYNHSKALDSGLHFGGFYRKKISRNRRYVTFSTKIYYGLTDTSNHNSKVYTRNIELSMAYSRVQKKKKKY
jgi:hypothetical protein